MVAYLRVRGLHDVLILYTGLDSGHYIITTDVIGHLFRTSMRGIAPYNNLLVDLFWSVIGMVSWLSFVDAALTRQADWDTDLENHSR